MDKNIRIIDTEEKKRDIYMDFLRGIAIISVIVGHSISDIREMDILFNLIYSFHMPLLFFVSAYVEEQNREKYTGKEGIMLLRRMCGLILPYISWTIINAAIDRDLQGLLLDLSGYRSNGLWFLPVLFGLKIMHTMYWLIRRSIGRNKIVTDVMCASALEIMIVLIAMLTKQPYIINMLSYTIPYFFAVILVEHESMLQMVNSEWLAAGTILAYALVFPYFSFYDTRWITQAVRIGLSLCVITIFCKFNAIRNSWNRKPFYSVICVCGENSLAIYVLHDFFIDYKKYFNMINSVFLVGILSLGLAILVAFVCIVISKVIGASSWCNKLLFGK